MINPVLYNTHFNHSIYHIKKLTRGTAELKRGTELENHEGRSLKKSREGRKLTHARGFMGNHEGRRGFMGNHEGRSLADSRGTELEKITRGKITKEITRDGA